MHSWRNVGIAILLGLAIYLMLFSIGYYLGQVAVGSGKSSWPIWYGISRQVVESLEAVAPGFVAGWVAARSGLVIGVVVGVFSALLTPLAVALSPFGALPFDAACALVVALAIGGSIFWGRCWRSRPVCA